MFIIDTNLWVQAKIKQMTMFNFFENPRYNTVYKNVGPQETLVEKWTFIFKTQSLYQSLHFVFISQLL